MFPLIFALVACQTPFGVDRHDLAGFRIAALSAAIDADDGVNASAAIVSDGHLWSEQAVALDWYWIADARDLESIDRQPDGTGPTPTLTLPDETSLLGLIAEDGAYLATLDVVRTDRAMPPVFVEADNDAVATNEKTTLTAFFGGQSTEGAHARWMATDGTFTEIDALTTTWKAPKTDGTQAILVLALDDAGRSQWSISDLIVGDPGEGVWLGSRWIPSDVPVPPGSYDAVLAEEDSSTSGVRIVSITAADGATLSCATPFDPRALADGRCTRAEVTDAPVPLVIE